MILLFFLCLIAREKEKRKKKNYNTKYTTNLQNEVIDLDLTEYNGAKRV